MVQGLGVTPTFLQCKDQHPTNGRLSISNSKTNLTLKLYQYLPLIDYSHIALLICERFLETPNNKIIDLYFAI